MARNGSILDFRDTLLQTQWAETRQALNACSRLNRSFSVNFMLQAGCCKEGNAGREAIATAPRADGKAAASNPGGRRTHDAVSGGRDRLRSLYGTRICWKT